MYYPGMIDALVQASERINGMYMNGVGTDRPRKPARTENLLGRISVDVAKRALMETYEMMQPQSGEEGYGGMVVRQGRGRTMMDEGPLGMGLIANLALSAENGRMGLKKNVPTEVRPITLDMRVSDMARIVATTWHTLEINRSTW